MNKTLLKTLGYENSSILIPKEDITEMDPEQDFLLVSNKIVSKKVSIMKRPPFKQLDIQTDLYGSKKTKHYSIFKTLKRYLKKGYSLRVNGNRLYLDGRFGDIIKTIEVLNMSKPEFIDECREKEKKFPLHITSKEIYEMVIADVSSDKVLSEGKICFNCGTGIRFRLLFNHTWIEYCYRCGAQSPKKPKVEKYRGIVYVYRYVRHMMSQDPVLYVIKKGGFRKWKV